MNEQVMAMRHKKIKDALDNIESCTVKAYDGYTPVNCEFDCPNFEIAKKLIAELDAENKKLLDENERLKAKLASADKLADDTFVIANSLDPTWERADLLKLVAAYWKADKNEN